MTTDEAGQRCARLAQELGLDASWVLHHVVRRAGKACRRCDGVGCRRCGWREGYADEAVEAALAWVRVNPARVRQLGELRDLAPDAAERRRVVEVQAWKSEHADLWAFLEDMLPCDFKRSVVEAVEALRVTDNQVAALREMVSASKRRPPEVGVVVNAVVRVTGARRWVNTFGKSVFRVDFRAEEGWAGRAEVVDPVVVSAVIARTTDAGHLRGPVVWAKEGYVVIAGRVEFMPVVNLLGVLDS